jgi:ribosome-associated translation inhibitor RaiA
MRIEVSGPAASHAGRMRAYAEFRVFRQLAPFAHEVKAVRVVVSRSPDRLTTSCVMSAELRRGCLIRSRSRSTKPSHAVDSAAAKLATATGTWLSAGHGNTQ